MARKVCWISLALAAAALFGAGCSSPRGTVNGTDTGMSGAGTGSRDVASAGKPALPTDEAGSAIGSDHTAGTQGPSDDDASSSAATISKGSVFDVKSGKDWAPAPSSATEFVTLDGKKIDLAKLKGQVVLIDYWAPWCPPCRAGLPFTQRLSDTFKGKGLTVLAMTSEPYDEVASFISSNNYHFPVVHDAGSRFASANKVTGLPTEFIIDKSGKIVDSAIGLNPQSNTIAMLKKAGLNMGSFAPKDDPLDGQGQ